MKIGYSFWGYMGDYKYNQDGSEASTPDGNAFYSWSIIKELQMKGHRVQLVMPDRDSVGWEKHQERLFSSFATLQRMLAYTGSIKTEYAGFLPTQLYKVFREQLWDVDLLLLEWRFPIEGRNTGKNPEQPDLIIQEMLLKWAKKHNKPVIVFDLDYKLTVDDIVKYDITHIVELGNKWNGKYCRKVEIPFDFLSIDCFKVEPANNSVVYVGNKYERDRSFFKYIVPIGKTDTPVYIYGKWEVEDSREFGNINFMGRISANKMHDAYRDKKVTVLLAKDSYYTQGFMTARIIEAIFYGCVPLFPEEFGDIIIKEYAGEYAHILKVSNHQEVLDLANMPETQRNDIIEYLRLHLGYMDSYFFGKTIEEMYELIKNNPLHLR